MIKIGHCPASEGIGRCQGIPANLTFNWPAGMKGYHVIDVLGALTWTLGIHGPLHTIGMLLALRHLGTKITAKMVFAVAIHDIGYIMTGVDEDSSHPELGAKIARRLLGKRWEMAILTHSREYAHGLGLDVGEFYLADKIWHTFVPVWLFRVVRRIDVGMIDSADTILRRSWDVRGRLGR